MSSHHLTLADWRLRVADLYGRVRDDPDPAAGHRRWVEARRELFATHPQSPTAHQPDLGEIAYWPYDPALRFDLPLLPAEPDERAAAGGDDGAVTLRRIGRLELPAPVGGSLDVWWLHQYAGGIFIPLKDGTSGAGSYGGGRYLVDSVKGAWLGGTDSSIVVDLNFAYHPSCRYDERWQCPLAPIGNTVTARVEAGEKL